VIEQVRRWRRGEVRSGKWEVGRMRRWEGGRGNLRAGAEGRGWEYRTDGAEMANGAEESGLAAGARMELG
jgi:hypothetical protein